MANAKKLIRRILSGRADANIPFSGLCRLLKQLGFAERIRGDHHIFTRDDVDEILNLRPKESLWPRRIKCDKSERLW